MPRILIPSPDDPRLLPYRDLPHANLTALSGRFIVEGKWLVERLAASRYPVESVLVDERQQQLIPPELPSEIPVYTVPANHLAQWIGFQFHRGILACGQRRPSATLEELVPARGPALVVAAVGIQDPTNLGGILRNCAAFGVDGVLLGHHCADPFSRRVLRVSMGTAFQLRIAVLAQLEETLRELQTAHDCQLVATVLADDAVRLERMRTPERMVLLFGNEGHGLPAVVRDQCDHRVTLPMELGTDSLNAAAASAVFLYHFTRIGGSRTPGPARSAS